MGGLVAFARTSKAASRLSEQLRVHHMEREYLAVVEGGASLRRELSATGSCRTKETGWVRTVSRRAGSEEARLRFRRLGRDGTDTALVHLRLETGRKHQIRVQLSHLAIP